VPSESELHLDVDTTGKVQLHQGINGLGGGVVDIDQTAVRAGFKMLAGVLVDVG